MALVVVMLQAPPIIITLQLLVVGKLLLPRIQFLEHKVTRIDKGINPHSGQITFFGIKSYMDSNYELSEDGKAEVVT